jgi:pimeloyl-ACP methyl ester carboxylesterase
MIDHMQKPSFLLLLFFSFHFAVNAQVDSVTGYFKSFDGAKIYYEVRGNGMPVVLVHGFMGSGESWKRTALFTDLLNAGYQVISFDMRGNGKSDKPHTASAYENDAEAKDIMGLLSELGVNTYDVVGYSRGSIIVSRLLVLDKRVRKAVLGGMGDGFTDPEWPRRKMFAAALSGEPVKELEGMVNYVKQSGLDQEALAYLQKFQP